jgi:hypothetical protein
MKRLTFLLGLAASATSLWAQTPSATPPAPPFLNRAPDSCQWTVSVKTASGGSGATGEAAKGEGGSRPRSTTVVKNKGVVYERQTGEDGRNTESWRIGPYLVSQFAGAWQVGPLLPSSFDSPDYVSTDFTGFDWLSEKNFVGEQNVMGKRCWVFRGRTNTSPGAAAVARALHDQQALAAKLAREEAARFGGKAPVDIPEETSFNSEDYEKEIVAYIDEATRLPVALTYGVEKGTVTRTYLFQTAPALVIPPDVKQLVDRYAARRKRM